jgi:hypothetical protein
MALDEVMFFCDWSSTDFVKNAAKVKWTTLRENGRFEDFVIQKYNRLSRFRVKPRFKRNDGQMKSNKRCEGKNNKSQVTSKTAFERQELRSGTESSGACPSS